MTRLHCLSDRALLALAHRGEPAAFGVLYDRHQRQAFRIALQVCRQREAAEDALQQAFLEVWRDADRFDPARGSVGGWIMTVVHCRSVDALRRRNAAGRQVAAEPSVAATAPDDTSATVGGRADAAAVRSALSRLPPKQQAVLLLSYRAQLTQTEIAAALDIPLGTVKGRVRLGLNTLRGAPEIGGLIR